MMVDGADGAGQVLDDEVPAEACTPALVPLQSLQSAPSRNSAGGSGSAPTGSVRRGLSTDTHGTASTSLFSSDSEYDLENVFANDMRARNIGKVEDELQRRRDGTGNSVRQKLQRMKTFIQPHEGQKWIHSTFSNFFFGGMIIVNAVFIGFETDYNRGEQQSFGLNVWFIMESVFLGIFILELLLRFHADGRVCERWSVFDMLIVLLGVVDTWVLPAIFDQGVSDMSGLTLFRLLRLVRLVRVLRILRLLRFVRELLLLVRGIAGALRALGWSFLLMGIVLYVSAVFTTEVIREVFPIAVRGSAADPDLALLETWFGSIGASFLTLSQLMTLEGWPTVVRETAMRHNKPWLLCFFMPFICCTNFALLNVVTALMVEKVFEFAQDEKLQDAKKTLRERKVGIQKIMKLFDFLDNDEDGKVSLHQVKEAAENPVAMKQFQELGIAKHDIDSLFLCLDVDGKGELTVAEFIEGCLRMHGPATSKDLLRIQYDVHRTMKAVNVRRLHRYVNWSMWCLQTDAPPEPQGKNNRTIRMPIGESGAQRRGATCLPERGQARSKTEAPPQRPSVLSSPPRPPLAASSRASVSQVFVEEAEFAEDSARSQTLPSLVGEMPGSPSASSTSKPPSDGEARSLGCEGGAPAEPLSSALPPEAQALLEEVMSEQQQTRQLLQVLGNEMRELRVRIRCNNSLVQPALPAPGVNADIGGIEGLEQGASSRSTWCSSNSADKAGGTVVEARACSRATTPATLMKGSSKDSEGLRKSLLQVPGTPGSCRSVERQASGESADATVTMRISHLSSVSTPPEVRRKKVTISESCGLPSGADTRSDDGFGIVPGSVQESGK